MRRAQLADLDAVLGTLVSGFGRDPLYRWLYPDDADRPQRLAEVFDLVVRAALASESAWVTADLHAVAVYTQAGVDLVDDDLGRRYLALLQRQLGARRAADAATGMAACADVVPAEAHDTLHSIAVDARRQGQGCGRRLLVHLLGDADRRQQPVHLDSSNPRNMSFYRRFGFEQIAAVEVPGGGPVMRAMWRPARGRRPDA